MPRPALHSDLPRPAAAGTHRAPFWAPWLCAPLFAGLPIVGCGLATPVVDPPRAVSGGSLERDRTPPARDTVGGLTRHIDHPPTLVPIGAVVPIRTVIR